MRRPDISEGEWRKLLREMSHMLGRIGWLVDTLLKLSRLDAGTVTLKQEKFPVSSLIEDALRTFAVSMELHGQTCIAYLYFRRLHMDIGSAAECDEKCAGAYAGGRENMD